MKLSLAVKVAEQALNKHPGSVLSLSESVFYRAKNGQYMTARVGNPAMLGRPQWSVADFYEKHKNILPSR